MKHILLWGMTFAIFRLSAQPGVAKATNNVLAFKYAEGTPIPGGSANVGWCGSDSTRLTILINHQATLGVLLAIKKTCRRMGLYLNYRALVFDQEQKLRDIEVEYALKRGHVAVAVAEELKDSTRFGVFGSITPGSYCYYVGYERK
jgi:hypothetical protein